MSIELAEVLRHFGPSYLRSHGLSTAQARAWRAIVACLTAALGGERLRCQGCGVEAWRWHSCRNRHCPRCGTRQREAWRAARMAELLDVPYAHLVFTLPHQLNALAAVHARWVYEALLRCLAATLTQFAADECWLGGVGGFTLVLHTWTQDLRCHLHVHALMVAGALGRDAEGAVRWVEPKRSRRFLFPVHALSRVFWGKFLDALRRAEDEGALPRDPAAIGAERIVAIRGDKVLLRLRADAHGGKRVVSIDGVQFIARLLQHVLPAGFNLIRHYGLLAPAAKAERLALARTLLAMPQPNARATEDALAFMQRVATIHIEPCVHCCIGRWRCVQTLPADRAALAAIIATCRGPP